MSYLIHEDADCMFCNRRPRRLRCSDCDAVGIVLTCEHAERPLPFERIGNRHYCLDCAEDRRAENPMQPVMGAVGTVVGLGIGLGIAGAMFGGDGDGMFDF